MKITLLLFLFIVFHSSANFSQQVTLSLSAKGITLKEALKEIEKQTEYTFLYDNSKVDVSQQVNVEIDHADIKLTMEEVLNNTDINFKIEDNHILLGNKYQDENFKAVTITGVVKDAQKNEPLPGANVTIKGTTTGTITDMDGKYILEILDKNAILVFSFVGYEKAEIQVNDQTEINVQLNVSTKELDEVVVIGYGTMRKQDLTGSISSVSADELNKGVVTTTEQVLQGKIAGLTVIKGSGDPTEGATMRLRGGTSLSAGSSPLIVVDGIPGVDINTVQPSDIVSIDVLKDASAAAIYGSRGANGVILITTSKPGKGKHVEYSNYFAFGKTSNYLDLLSADEWRQKVEELELTKAIDWEDNTDWQKEITQSSFSQSHTITFNSANDDGGYRASITYMNNEGVIKTSYLERLGVSLAAYTYGLNDKLKLDFGIHSSFDNYIPVNKAVFERAYNVNPTAPLKDSAGVYFQTDNNLAENPVEILMNESNDNTTKRVLGFAKAELEIIKGLKAVLNVSSEYNSHQGRYYLPTFSKFGSSDKGYGNRSLDDYTSMQLETYITYNKEFLTNHRINIMGGYSYLDNTKEGFFTQRRGFDSDMFLYNNLGAGIDYRSDDLNSYKGNNKLISFYGRANYSYSGRYILTATLRRDGSSRFGKNNKWGLFPSVAAAWKVSDEAFLNSTTDWLDILKVRIGYGVTGSQDAIGNYTTLSLYGTDPATKYYDASTQVWKASYSPTQNSNPDLKWETTTQSNIGIDFSIFNKLSATIDLYKKLTSDLIFKYAVPMPPNIYFETLANVGDLSNKGIELSLDWSVIQTNDLNWNLNISMAKNNMKIEKLSEGEYETDAVGTGSLHGLRGMSNQYSQTIREGYAVGTFWGQECTGLDSTGQFLDVNGDILDPNNHDLDTNLGNAQPKFSLGLSTVVTYKNFDLSISTYGLFGQKVLNATAMSMNDKTRFPELNVPHTLFDDNNTSNPTFCSYWIEDASFFRLQSVSLGYTIKVEKAGIQKLRVYVTGENLFVITKYNGLDPEIKIEQYNNDEKKMDALLSPGIDRYDVYPRPKTMTVGLNLSF